MGNETRLRGLAFERELEKLHAIYLDEGKVRMRHMGLTADYRGGKLRARKSLPDFGGELAPYGQAVKFDAKVIKPKSNGKSIYSHDKRRAHQARELWEARQFGAICFILVSDDFKRHFLLWPKPHWREKKGWSVDLDCGDQRIVVPVLRKEGTSDLLPDWYSIIRDCILTNSGLFIRR